MQSTLISASLAARTTDVRPEAKQLKSAPVELSLSSLKQVSGGAPNGTWSAAASTNAPNGSW